MTTVLLVQLPIPRQNFGRKTGNVPLAAACLKQAAAGVRGAEVEILPESIASYLGDAALADLLLGRSPDVVGLSVFSWNLERSLDLAATLKAAYGPRIVFGGPEITPDNQAARSEHVDFYVLGEGEEVFRRLLTDPGFWERGCAALPAAALFRRAASPYLEGLLEPHLENLMLLETQRGCPYRCGFCHYNKARSGLVFAGAEDLLRAAAWAAAQGISEVYLLDPSLNARPGLKPLLEDLARLNTGRRMTFFSEIRAEAIDEELADLFSAAGFDWFEIGLQSTNPRALELMRRPTNLGRFVAGARRLKERGITPSIDLIIGLPGDDLAGFMRSVDFVADHGFQDDVQIFPLAVLPGTDFRRRSAELGLDHEPHPPYTVTRTGGFAPEDFLLAYDYAETRLDTVFFPLPDLDVSFRISGSGGPGQSPDLRVRLAGGIYVAKLNLGAERPLAEIEKLARRLTLPYQVLVGPALGDVSYLKRVLAVLTAANPFTPLEVVFFEPAAMPDTAALLSAVRLRRPHFLDGDLRFLFPRPGNRAVLFTVVCGRRKALFQGEMQRQVFWWRGPGLPELKDLARFSGLDGVLVDAAAGRPQVRAWQDRLGRQAAERHHLSFADAGLQRRWVLRTAPDEYAAQVMDYVPRR